MFLSRSPFAFVRPSARVSACNVHRNEVASGKVARLCLQTDRQVGRRCGRVSTTLPAMPPATPRRSEEGDEKARTGLRPTYSRVAYLPYPLSSLERCTEILPLLFDRFFDFNVGFDASESNANV